MDKIPFQIISLIGKGGMGEVYAAYDPKTKRKIALKKIRPDLCQHPNIRARFLKEAYTTCQLVHPAIMPIYTISAKGKSAFYTMPLVEGRTLKEVIRTTRRQELDGQELDPIGSCISALVQIFMTICQAIAYAHSKGVIHRDIKPENIIVGKYGEVLILDWGLAKWDKELDDPKDTDIKDIQGLYTTKAGKIVGTISYMAPERATGQPADIQTEVYALGVILYQILTLQLPFKRKKDIQEFKKSVHLEKIRDPSIAAPHRDIPKNLSRATMKCLATDLNERYKSVHELIHDLKVFTEGKSDWFQAASLKIDRKKDWEFQESVLLAEHAVITRLSDSLEWVNLMISRQSFPGNIKFEFTIKLKANSEGVGFLFNIPEKTERKHLSDGYCLWIGSASSKCSKLLRSNVEVVKAQGIFLNSLTNYHVKIEKIDSSIYFYIDKQLQFTYVTQLPLMGTHVGLIIKDDHFEISDIDIWVGSLSLNTSCLAIPDAFLAHQDFPKALSEYKRIAYSFPDRSEGREAQFKAGVTLLEEAKNSLKSQELIEEAIAQFEKLKKTPSAPLYYFGLALAYKELGECDEEIKCYEIAFRRYRSHPLLQLLQEHILFRMQESARKERLLTYQLISFTLARLPKTAIDCSCEKIFHNLNNHLEDLPFIEKDANYLVTNFKKNLHIPLLFWLSKPKALEEYVEIISEDPKNNLRELKNSLFCAIEWKHFGFAAKIFSSLRTHLKNKEIQLIENLFKFHLNKKVYLAKDNFTDIAEIRILLTLSNLAADDNQLDLSNSYLDKVDAAKLSHDWQVQVDSKYIINYLLQEKWDLALSKLEKHAGKYLNRDSSLLFFLYGCYLTAVEGDEIAKVHFNSVLPTTYPRSWSLASHFISGYIDLQNRWFDQAFDYEKKQLYHQLYIFYHAQGERTKSLYFQKLYQEIYLSENYLKGELF